MKGLSGLYLVVPPDADLESVWKALRGGVDVLQFWSQGMDVQTAEKAGSLLRALSERFAVPFIVNNDLELAKSLKARGVHMDTFSLEPQQIRDSLDRSAIVGYTIGNNLEMGVQAEKFGADYISFCSIFPTESVVECEIVPLEIVRSAKSMVKIPVFASGGINLKNIRMVLEAGVDGVAISSAILRSPDPETSAREFKKVLEGSKSVPVRLDQGKIS